MAADALTSPGPEGVAADPAGGPSGRGPLFDMTGMRALVTGASGGIGQAIASAFAAHGARLALSGTRVDALKEVAAGLGGGAILPCNLSDQEAVEKLVPAAVEALGGLDILVCNAGITRDGLVLRMKDEDWTEVLRVNLESSFRLSRAAIKPMMRARFGRILYISSVVGAAGNPGQVNYAASKAGLVGMAKALAQEVASRQVTVNCIAPGLIATAMTESLAEAQRVALLARIPSGALGLPEDVAAAAVYLASREAAYVTGQTIHVNGGMIMP